jgi:hypothetical protein
MTPLRVAKSDRIPAEPPITDDRAGELAAEAAERAEQNPLLRPPAVRDNAAMQTEPPTNDPPKRKRRWLQFKLRSPFTIRADGCDCQPRAPCLREIKNE